MMTLETERDLMEGASDMMTLETERDLRGQRHDDTGDGERLNGPAT